MYTILIVGVGQLGSRHLQGVLKVNLDLEIYLLDPSESSRKTAQIRANEIVHAHTLNYLKDWTGVPDHVDVCIVATSSDIRERVVEELLRNTTVNYLILEKVLFEDIESYDRVRRLLEEKSVRTWVNHPKRTFQSFQSIRERVSKASSPPLFIISGNSWGIGCNGLHCIDTISYLRKTVLATVHTESLGSEVLESKRSGFVEFEGTLMGCMEDKSTFLLKSIPGERNQLSWYIDLGDSSIRIEEGGENPTSQFFSKGKSESVYMEHYTAEFQSDLSKDLIYDLLQSGTCQLPDYSESAHNHLIFINSLLKFYNEITGENTTILKIT